MKNSNTTVGILSDSHGFLDPRVADVVNQCDYIVHAGDIFNAHVLEQLKPKKELIAVAGNNDYDSFWSEEEIDIVNALPNDDQLELPGGLLVVEHGHRFGNHPEHCRALGSESRRFRKSAHTWRTALPDPSCQ